LATTGFHAPAPVHLAGPLSIGGTEAILGGSSATQVPMGPTEVDRPVPPTPPAPATVIRPAGSLAVRVILLVVLVVLLAVLAYATYDLLRPREKLAVLAFAVPARSSPEVDKLIEALRNQLLTELQNSKVLKTNHLEVIKAGVPLGGKTSAELGKELDVALLLAGDVNLSAAGEIRLKLSLSDARRPQTPWSKTYEHSAAFTPEDSAGDWRAAVVADAVQQIQEAVAKRRAGG
jgi:TolB-like protein